MTAKRKGIRSLVAILCTVVLLTGDTLAYLASGSQAPASPAQSQPSTIPPDQLDSLVAPIALYPDPLLAQTLAASTYPLEIIQLQQWLAQNKNLDEGMLYVKELLVDVGPSMKRMWARGRGRADRLIKRSCHLSVVIGEIGAKEVENGSEG